MSKITKRYRRERDSFSEEEDIPLAELEGRLKVRKRRSEETVDLCATSDDEMSVISDEAILVYGFMKKRKRKERRKKRKKNKEKKTTTTKKQTPPVKRPYMFLRIYSRNIRAFPTTLSPV